jgi:hypothetical protein
VTADRNNRGGSITKKEPETTRLSLLGGDPGQSNLPAQTSADRCAPDLSVVKPAERLEESGTGILVMLKDSLPATAKNVSATEQLDDLDRFRTKIDA